MHTVVIWDSYNEHIYETASRHDLCGIRNLSRNTTHARMVISDRGRKQGKRQNSDWVAFLQFVICIKRQIRGSDQSVNFGMHCCSLHGIGDESLQHRTSPWFGSVGGTRFSNVVVHRPAHGGARSTHSPTHPLTCAGRQGLGVPDA